MDKDSLGLIKIKLEKKFDQIYMLLDNVIILDSYYLVPLEIHGSVENLDSLIELLQRNHVELVALLDSSDQIKFYVKAVPDLLSTHPSPLHMVLRMIYLIPKSIVLVLSVVVYIWYNFN